jgi:hypothetical protein
MSKLFGTQDRSERTNIREENGGASHPWEPETPRRLRPFPVLYVIPNELYEKHKTDYEKTDSDSSLEYVATGLINIDQ